ncbi:homeobox protein Hmx-like [Teleopsis dalmanni]|nr:homeobox protein Hmx-like [Teleopsis dalmanni]
MSTSEAEVDISVVSSPEPSPTGCGNERDSPMRCISPAPSAGSAPTSTTSTPTTAAGTPTSNANYHSPTAALSAVPPTVLHHHLQHHLNSLSGHPVALHHALHTFGHLHPGHPAHPAHQQLLQHAVTPTAVTQLAAVTERFSPPAMAAMAPKSPAHNGDEVTSLVHNNNNKLISNNNSDSNGSSQNLANSNGNNGNESNKVTTGNGFTSFSISSILSRNEPAKKCANNNNVATLITPIPHLPQPGSGGPQDAAMLSR